MEQVKAHQERIPTEGFIQEIIKAVRADKEIGAGTCSVIEEAHTDLELREAIVRLYQKMTPRWRNVVKAYVNKFREIHWLYLKL